VIYKKVCKYQTEHHKFFKFILLFASFTINNHTIFILKAIRIIIFTQKKHNFSVVKFKQFFVFIVISFMKSYILLLFTTILCLKSNAQWLHAFPKSFEKPCNGTNCLTLNFKAPTIKSTQDYLVQSIPYNPYEAVTPTGTINASLYTDDRFSDVFNLPFQFCFFDSIFSKAIISSNGHLTFDLAQANLFSSFNVPNPIPSVSYSRAAIMASFTDLDAGSINCPPDRKIEWRVEGTAPFRRFVVSYYNVGTYSNGQYSNTNSCNFQNPNTFQIVLYESTSFIDIYIKNKICASSSSGSKSILGIQNWARNKAVAAPNKNAVNWTAINEAYGFRPNGNTSLIQSAELLTLTGTTISPINIIAINNDSTVFQIPNYCITSGGVDTLLVKANYNSCTSGLPFSLIDTIYVGILNNLNIITNITNATCNGTASGTVSLISSGGAAPYTYSINGSAFTYNTSYNLAAANYTVTVKDANNCTKTQGFSITEPTALQNAITLVNATCTNSLNGSITLNTTGSTGPYTYNVNGAGFVNNNTFTVPNGFYTIITKDVNNCTRTDTASILLQNNITVKATNDTTICEGQPALLNAISNGANFSWQTLNGTVFTTNQSINVSPIVTTAYVVIAQLGSCVAKDTTIVNVNAAPIANAGVDKTICFGKTEMLNGSGGVQYTWAPTATLSNANINNPIATTTSTTQYWLQVIDNNNCMSLKADTMQLTITPPLQATAGPDTTIVQGQPYLLFANLLGNASSLTGLNYNWSPAFGLNNTNIQNPIATLSNNQTYTVEITTADGCKGNASVKLKVLKGPDIYIPTAFSPNGDGNNDVLYIYPVGIKKFDFLRIFNRWGQLVFETKNPALGWNGFFKNAALPTGAYVFNVQATTDQNKVINKKGTVMIVR
jgi:gliding motility-associated-like protein